MPDLKPFTMPSDAGEKAAEAARSRDYYAELTDEERAEEGLPPREPAKPDDKPAAETKPETPPKIEKPPGDPEPEEPEEDDDEAVERLFEEIAGLREDIASSLGKPEPSAPEKKDELLEAALAHGDEVVRGLAQRLEAAEKRLSEHETQVRERRQQEQLAQDDKEFDAVQSSYLVGGKPMTDEHVEQVENYILRNPEVGRRLSIEQITRVVFPDAVKAAKSPPAKRPGDQPNGDGPPVATIVDEGGSPGGTSPQKFKPRPNETIESAVNEAGKRLFGINR